MGFDTSCYTTSVALASMEGQALVYHQSRKLLDVPEGAQGLKQSDAVFQHVKCLPGLVEGLMAGHPEVEIVSVCASVRPRPQNDSYMPVFRAGESCARTAAAALRVPFFATTHQQGHVRAAMVETDLTPADELVALHLSGGTTEALWVRKGEVSLLGGTKDLHAGQFIDRVGVRMGLPFPAGPSLESIAKRGRSSSVLAVTVRGLDCHFSGAEAQAIRLLEAKTLSNEDIAAEVFSCVARTVARLALAACMQTGTMTVLLGGGVASSQWIRDEVRARIARANHDVRLHFGKPELSGDNAVGVAVLGLEQYMQKGEKEYASDVD